MNSTTSIKQTILVVDDTEQNVTVVSQILRSAGYNVIPAFSGTSALGILERRQPNLILLDVMMPDMDGYEVCEKIKAQDNLRSIPVIFLSALHDTDKKVKALEVGGVDYITKPFQEAEVLARVKLHIRTHDLEIQRQLHTQQLEKLNSEKDRLMGIVSHDLRSPLSGIVGLSELLKDAQEPIDVEFVRQLSEVIFSTSSHLISLVNDLLDIAKIESGEQHKLKLTEEPVKEIFKTVKNIFFQLAKHKSISLELLQEDELQLIHCDVPKMKQIFNNLISNAIKFTPENGYVYLKHYQREENNIFEVQDTGIGISPEDLPKLYEKFGDHQRLGTDGEKGTGLGMPIVKSFVDLHDGTIEIKSIVGEGTTFVITLPKQIVTNSIL